MANQSFFGTGAVVLLTLAALAQLHSMVSGSLGRIYWVPTLRSTTCHHPCDSSYALVDGAKATWALENHKSVGESVSPEDLRQYFAGGRLPECGSGGYYVPGAVGEAVTCSVPEHTLWRLGQRQRMSGGGNPLDPALARATCRDHLRLIDAVKRHWAEANHKRAGVTPALAQLFEGQTYYRDRGTTHCWLIFSRPVYLELTIPTPRCPAGGTYRVGAVNHLPACSFPGHSL